MGTFLEDVLRERKFEYIVFRSVTLAVIILIATAEYSKLLFENPLFISLMTLIISSIIFFTLIERELKKNG
jgi:hypothetical protein